MNALIEKARERTMAYRKAEGPEIVGLALAWLRGEVTYMQACAAIGTKGSPYCALARGLREAYRKGQLRE